MADLPAEFSEGTLERALAHPEDGSIAIAWGDSRKRLLLIKRRIEILGGSAELRDHAGAFEQRLTGLRDRFAVLWREPAADGGKGAGAVSRAGVASLVIVVAAALAALVYAHGARDVHARLVALRGGAFTLGLISARSFVQGVRRWYDGEGALWLSVLLVLVPTSTLMAAGYQGYKLGLIQEGAAAVQGTGTATQRPLMKPFQALLVELRHRKQRAELAAALASDDVVVSNAAEAGAAASQLAAAGANAAAPVNDALPREAHARRGDTATRDSLPRTAAGRVKDRREAERGARASDGAHTWAARAATAIAACVWAASASHAAAAVAMSGHGAWLAVSAGGNEIDATVVVSAQTNAPAVVASEEHAIDRPAPRPLHHPPPQHAREWEPLRSIADINVLHVAVALVLSLMTFALGLWAGRRRAPRAGVSAADGDGRSTPLATEADGGGLARTEPSTLVASVAANADAPVAEPLPEPPIPLPILVIEPSNDADVPAGIGQASAAITAASAAAHVPAEHAAPKPAKTRAAGAARGGIQEETVVRRRPDNRRDD